MGILDSLIVCIPSVMEVILFLYRGKIRNSLTHRGSTILYNSSLSDIIMGKELKRIIQ
jgi:hypothetical protein